MLEERRQSLPLYQRGRCRRPPPPPPQTIVFQMSCYVSFVTLQGLVQLFLPAVDRVLATNVLLPCLLI